MNLYHEIVAVCEILQSEGASIVFDFSYQPWQQGLTYVHKYNIPYIRVDRLLSPFVDMFMKYLLEKNANDAAIIVTNKEDETSLLLDVLDGLPIRVALLNYNNNENPKFIQYLGSMRPSPSYYGIIADGINMKTVFEEVCDFLGLGVVIFSFSIIKSQFVLLFLKSAAPDR